MASVQLRGIAKSYSGKAPVLKGIDLDIGDGEFIVFVGPSGCGKSTLLRMIAGLEAITEGDLRIGDARANEIAAADRGIAMVFQSYALYPHMTVYENMGFALRLAGIKGPALDDAVRAAAATLQLTDLLQRKPGELSGGQRQRVAIGRAIVRKPRVFLFDEPLSNLDASLRGQMRLELARLHRDLGATMIYVTHDQVEAMTLGQRIAVFNGGRIEQVGTPQELYARPANLFVARFLGAPAMNLLRAEADDAGVHLAGGPTLPIKAPAGALTLGIRPEHLRVAPDGELPLRVSHCEYLGDQHLIYAHAECADDVLVLRATEAAAPGSLLRAHLPSDACHLFNSVGDAIDWQKDLHL